MGYWLQIKLLVWKNFTLKRRKPLVLLLETFIPLFLFIIIVYIRQNQPTKAVGPQRFRPYPLPSAGLLPIALHFCDDESGGLDENNFPNGGRQRVHQIITKVDSILKHFDYSNTMLAVDDFDRLSEASGQIIDDLLLLYSSMQQIIDSPLSNIFLDTNSLISILTDKFEMSLDSANALLNVTLRNFQLSNDTVSGLMKVLEKPIFNAANPNNIKLLMFKIILNLKAMKWPSFTQLASVYNIFFEDIDLHSLCNSPSLNSSYTTNPVELFLMSWCRANPKTRIEVLNFLGNHLELDFANKINFVTMISFSQRVSRNFRNIWSLVRFMKLLDEFAYLSENLQLGACSDNVNNNNTKAAGGEQDNALRMWYGIQRAVCGWNVTANEDDAGKKAVTGKTPFQLLIENKGRLIAQLLRHDVKILYAPNNTAADDIIKMANSTFHLLEVANGYVDQLASATLAFQTYISSGEMEKHYNKLQKITNDISGESADSPVGIALVIIKKIVEYIKPDKAKLLHQMDTLLTGTCHWGQLVPKQSVNLFRGFRDETEALFYFKERAYAENVTVFASVIFHMNGDGSMPKHLTYVIRQNATMTPQTTHIRPRNWAPGPLGFVKMYYDMGFIWIQDIIDRAIISIQAGREVVEPGTYIQQFPEPCFIYDRFFQVIRTIIPLTMVVAWLYTVAMLVQDIVYEKEKRLKEVMKVMGLTNLIHWLSFFLTSFLQFSITILILTACLIFGGIIRYTNFFLLFLLLELYALVTIAFSFLISTLFSKAKLAAACAGIIYFMSYIPWIYIAIKEDLVFLAEPLWRKVLASTLSATAFGLAMRSITMFEHSGTGANFGNWGVSPMENDDLSLQLLFMILIFDSLLYCTLIWYIQIVFPGSYGLPRPWYFPFTKSYWCGSRRRCKSVSDNAEYDLSANQNAGTEGPLYFERDPVHLPIGVSIRNLVKVFKSGKKLAVDGLSLNFYEGQITSFLGHNGAGKTTTMSILTGLLPPTSGTALVYDLDIRKDMDSIRTDLGMCPQHNVLFDELTVEEHLWFYCRLKGMSSNDIIIETENILQDIDLVSKRSQTVDCLAGGMTRKLSVAIAFVGGSRTVILDEPTSGVDPCSRRAIWDLILKYKKGRTILLSTHHMDEAEILGDRIAVIANGKLLCCGSPLFLKSQLGSGYHLYLVKKGSAKDLDEEHSADSGMDLGGQPPAHTIFRSSCCEQVVTNFIRKDVPSATFESETPYELHYLLPTPELRRGNFERLFLSLDAQCPALQVESYGVKSCTLEEVFLRVTSPCKELNGGSDERNRGEPAQDCNLVDLSDETVNENGIELHGAYNCEGNGTSVKHVFDKKTYHKLPFDDSMEIDFSPLFGRPGPSQPLIKGHYLYLMQFFAVLKKRFWCTKRNTKGIFSQVILPAIFIVVAMTVALTAPSVDDLPPLKLSPSQYHNLTAPKGQFVPFGNHRDDYKPKSFSPDALSGDLEDTFHLPSGIGASCVAKPRKKVSSNHPLPLKKEEFEQSCHPFFTSGIFRSLDHRKNFLQNMLSKRSSLDVIGVKRDVNSTFFSSHRFHPSCECAKASSGFVCSSDSYEAAPTFRVVSGETMVNVSGDNEVDYLLYTSNDFRSNRYGSLTIGLTRGFIPPSFSRNAPAVVRRFAARNVAKVFYNTNGHHSMPTFLNVLNNAILRANLPKNMGIDPSVYGITVINHPLPDTNSLSNQERLAQGTDVIIAIFVIIAMSFIPASFVLFLVTERSSKAKHLQMVSGVKPIVYWVGNYVWDFCNSIIPAIVCICILMLFNIHAYTSQTNLPAVIVLFLVYGWSVTPVMYPVSYLFREPSAAYVFLIVINLFTGISSLILDSLLKNLSWSNNFMLNAYHFAQALFLLFPNYCLGQGLVDLSGNDFNNMYLIKTGRANEALSPWAWHIMPKKLLAMAGSGLFFFCITLLCERKRSRKSPAPNGLPAAPLVEDDDVALERQRVADGEAANAVLRLDNLTKLYRTRKLGDCLAVDHLSLGINHGECLGLLGTNGAGKTTVFALLTGDTSSTEGDVFINGFSVNNTLAQAQQFIGYCPQSDALYDELTAREHLSLYCSFRGIHRGEHKKTVEWAISKMDLVPYADRQAGTYSGGNRRKLATALALIANPDVILLDEPSTGMDPHSKRFLWEAILDLIRRGHSVVLSSHSMEECEALCSRVAIMVNGRFCCLGSVQHLKNKFGGGYTISVCVKDQKFAPVVNFFRATFPNAVLQERHHHTMHYSLNSATTSLAYIFSCMEEALTHLPIEDYSVCQNTLDNVFVNFVKKYHGLASDCHVETIDLQPENVPNGAEKGAPETSKVPQAWC